MEKSDSLQRLLMKTTANNPRECVFLCACARVSRGGDRRIGEKKEVKSVD